MKLLLAALTLAALSMALSIVCLCQRAKYKQELADIRQRFNHVSERMESAKDDLKAARAAVKYSDEEIEDMRVKYDALSSPQRP